jgi:Cu(I)/Ag(I) efflux system membrane fusion protein/cobalt-zinc-cadmium efflux system membrane fusion protein
MLKHFLITIALVSFLGVFALAQEKPETEKNETHKHMENMKSDSTDQPTIIREGEIDLTAIDANKDGKVFQDQMCWNVISDETGECPLCGMTLKEVSLGKAKENLISNDFKVRDN